MAIVPPFQAQTVPQSNLGIMIDASPVTANPLGVMPTFPTQITKIAFGAGAYLIVSAPGQTLHVVNMKPGSTSGITIYDDNTAPTAGHELYFASGNMSLDVNLLYDYRLVRGIYIVTTGAVNFDCFTIVIGLV